MGALTFWRRKVRLKDDSSTKFEDTPADSVPTAAPEVVKKSKDEPSNLRQNRCSTNVDKRLEPSGSATESNSGAGFFSSASNVAVNQPIMIDQSHITYINNTLIQSKPAPEIPQQEMAKDTDADAYAQWDESYDSDSYSDWYPLEGSRSAHSRSRSRSQSLSRPRFMRSRSQSHCQSTFPRPSDTIVRGRSHNKPKSSHTDKGYSYSSRSRSRTPSPRKRSIYRSRSKASSSYYGDQCRSPTIKSARSRSFLIPDDDKGTGPRVNGRLGKRARSSSSEDIPTIRARKFSKRAGQAADYEDETPLLLKAASSCLHALIAAVDEFPDTRTKAEFVRQSVAWANEFVRDDERRVQFMASNITEIIDACGAQLHGDFEAELNEDHPAKLGFRSGFLFKVIGDMKRDLPAVTCKGLCAAASSPCICKYLIILFIAFMIWSHKVEKACIEIL
ncbi:hypothetical protein P691DRAFT_801724 [Macrolepiota fuliginosa MF-IS2]|uniref:Uncharacterized protein n=1 Tax=Macrolepiota fuliginosa MF-IS2 TaxID=1400762 RepID=A0A9P6C0X7_9AGAR|nr:hypothetical protein P691DRAFT_801724 [Macrolepiota fuliginosa MF-IS2]